MPSWRKAFLRTSYLALIATFMVLIFELPGDLFLGDVGTLISASGAIRISDWFIWRRLEPGRPLEADNPSLWSSRRKTFELDPFKPRAVTSGSRVVPIFGGNPVNRDPGRIVSLLFSPQCDTGLLFFKV